MSTRITTANETDVPELLSLNNRYSASGLTLARSPEFAANHLGDYRVLRDATGGILGCVALDEYSPSVAEIISLAVAVLDASTQLPLERAQILLFRAGWPQEWDSYAARGGVQTVTLRPYDDVRIVARAPEHLDRCVAWSEVPPPHRRSHRS